MKNKSGHVLLIFAIEIYIIAPPNNRLVADGTVTGRLVSEQWSILDK